MRLNLWRNQEYGEILKHDMVEKETEDERNFINCGQNASTGNQYLKLGPLWIISIIFHHKLMVVIWRVEIVKHCQCFNLGPTSPSSNHSHSPILVLDPVLTSTTSERVGAIQSPGLVAKLLQIRSECPTQDVICLY